VKTSDVLLAGAQRFGQTAQNAGSFRIMVVPLIRNCTPIEIIRKPVSRVSATMPVAPSRRLTRQRPGARTS